VCEVERKKIERVVRAFSKIAATQLYRRLLGRRRGDCQLLAGCKKRNVKPTNVQQNQSSGAM
jgi:UDP-glucose 4-epimerase